MPPSGARSAEYPSGARVNSPGRFPMCQPDKGMVTKETLGILSRS